MNLPPLNRDQVRSVDKTAIDEYEISGLVLMENAGSGAARIIADVSPPGEVLILCGRGNNAGDGYVIARHLQLLDRQTRIVSLVDFESLSHDALANANIALKSEIDCRVVNDRESLERELSSVDIVVECLLGTGARGAPRELFADAIRLANRADAFRIAIDIPAGLDCDTGLSSDPTFRADRTISFVSTKVGFSKQDAAEFLGVIDVVGIGVPQRLLQQIAESARR